MYQIRFEREQYSPKTMVMRGNVYTQVSGQTAANLQRERRFLAGNDQKAKKCRRSDILYRFLSAREMPFLSRSSLLGWSTWRFSKWRSGSVRDSTMVAQIEEDYQVMGERCLFLRLARVVRLLSIIIPRLGSSILLGWWWRIGIHGCHLHSGGQCYDHDLILGSEERVARAHNKKWAKERGVIKTAWIDR